MSLFILPADPSLNMSASEVSIDHILLEETQSIINRMLDITKGVQTDTSNGVMVGLAAPQIGVPKRIIIVDISVESDRKNFGNSVLCLISFYAYFSRLRHFEQI